MMEENLQVEKNLEELKKLIQKEIRPLIGHLKSPLDRYHAYMSLLRNEWDTETAYKAFHEAQTVEKPEDKFYSLESLSNEIYYHAKDSSPTLPNEV